MIFRRAVPLLLVLVLTVFASGQSELNVANSEDADRDGIADAKEQALLDKFRPTFFVSRAECDQLPASFKPGLLQPVVEARDGSIYGQAFRSTSQTADRVRLELHYFHLWSRDCGRISHKLDVEHASVLVGASSLDAPVSEWKAEHWYTAAHEDTVCNSSRWVRASELNASEGGAKVWISAGKHASYFSESLCRGGCGGDQCENSKEFQPPAVINIGEVGAPLNGASWTASARWTLKRKMRSDFPEPILAQLEKTPAVEMKHNGSMQAVILGSSDALGALAIGRDQTTNAMSTGTKHTGRAIGTAYRSVKKALKPLGTAEKKPDTQTSGSTQRGQ